MGLFDQVLKKTQNAAGDFMKNAGEAIQNFDADQAKEDIANGAKSLAGSARKAADQIAENMPKSMDDIDVKKTASDLAGKTKEAVARWQKDTQDSREQVKEALKKDEERRCRLTREDAVRILYCVMACDGTVDDQEKQKLLSIGEDLIHDFSEKEETIMRDVADVTEESSGDDYFYDLRDRVNDCLKHSEENRKDADVDGKLLLWNMLAVAESDGTYSQEEKKLIHYTAKKMNFEDSVVDEMELSAKTIETIEQEENWLKDQDLKYSEVEPQIEMLEKRKKAVMDGIAALIKD